MFRVRYDATSGQLRRQQRLAVGPPGNRKMRTANSCGSSGGINRYSPVFDRAEEPGLAQDFLPADPQTQNKLFRQIIDFDPVAGPTTEYWTELAFGEHVILSGVQDDKILKFYNDAIEASGVEALMPSMLGNYLIYGNVVFHMNMDESLGYWDSIVIDDPDTVHVQVSPFPKQPPIIDLQPRKEYMEWATSQDPRIIEQRRQQDPALIALMASGQSIPLAPENSMFMPRRAYADDHYGTSYLTRILPFWVYEKATMDASIAGARRKAGPLYHVTAWEDAAPSELETLDGLFAMAEEDPIGGRVVTREGVTVNPIGGGGGDIWKWSDEAELIASAKMRALGVSAEFLEGNASYNSMETILSVFLEKVKSVRRLFTQKVITDKILRQLAINHGFYKTSEAQLKHGYRIARRRNAPVNDAELILPVVEWDQPLEPVADRDFLDILNELEEKGFPIPVRVWAQATGYDLDKALDSQESDLEARKAMRGYQSAIVEQDAQFGFDPDGNYVGDEDTDERGGGMGGFGDELGGGFGDEDEEFGFDEEEAGGGGDEFEGFEAPEAPELSAGGEEGAGAGMAASRFPVRKPNYTRVEASDIKIITPTESKRTGKVNAPGTHQNIEEMLDHLPLWDNGDTLFGLHRRRAAQLLDEIDHTDPNRRDKLLNDLPSVLRKKKGLSPLQAEALVYVGMRLGYLPKGPLSPEAYETLGRLIAGKMNGSGLTKQVTNELMAMSAIMKKAGTARTRPEDTWTKSLPLGESKLHHSKILTGV